MVKEICIDARMLFCSGIGTYLRNVLPLLPTATWRLKLIVRKADVDKAHFLNNFDLILCEAPIYSPQEQCLLPWKIPRCDLFWSPHYNIPLLPIAARKRLVTIHDLHPFAFWSQLRWTQKLYAKQVLGSAVRRSAAIITVSDFSRTELCAKVRAPVQKISVIHLGVDGARFTPLEDGFSGIVRKKYYLPDKFLLFVGNRKVHKNLAGLLRALIHAGEKLAKYHVVVVGAKQGCTFAGVELAKSVDEEKIRARVHWIEFVDEDHLPSLYRLARMTVVPSLYEGFGLPALEAMSCGSPIAVSHRASLPEVCEDAAVYFDPDHPRDIARVLIDVLHNRRMLIALKEKGMQRAKKFCWQRCAEGHHQVLDALCNT